MHRDAFHRRGTRKERLMTIQLNHTHFLVVDLDNGVSLDFSENGGNFSVQHYAFLVSEQEFDGIFGRIRAMGLDYWADPARTRLGEINHNDGGRGVYFLDPDGHVLEAITRPYGSGG
jgi:catechol 2,3-dioxygenase-like lactoylglutathione lyase family enzyme